MARDAWSSARKHGSLVGPHMVGSIRATWDRKKARPMRLTCPSSFVTGSVGALGLDVLHEAAHIGTHLGTPEGRAPGEMVVRRRGVMWDPAPRLGRFTRRMSVVSKTTSRSQRTRV
jgi:hypothetical protein